MGDASEDLLRAALINREGDLAILSIHRLVQSAVRKRLSESETIKKGIIRQILIEANTANSRALIDVSRKTKPTPDNQINGL